MNSDKELREAEKPFKEQYGIEINGKWIPLSELPTDINELNKLLKPAEAPKISREELIKIIAQTIIHKIHLNIYEHEIEILADAILSAIPKKQEALPIQCKYAVISHGIGISGKVEEIILHCEMDSKNDYKEFVNGTGIKQEER